jgi:hypothetical protein
MPIVEYTGIGLYPPFVRDVINATWDMAVERQSALDVKIANATSGWLDTATAPTISASIVGVPTVTEPSITVPASASVSDVTTTFGEEYGELVTLLEGKFSTFLGNHFPAADANQVALEAWLADGLANPDQVLPPALAATIWEEDRTRVLRDSTRASADVVALWASMGHPLSGGEEAYAVNQIVQASHRELAQSSRNVAVKTFEMAYDKVKFIISSIAAAQQAAQGAALEYVKAVAVGPDIASRLTDAAYSAETKLMAAASALYGARADAAKVALAATQHNAQATQSAAEKNQASELTVMHERASVMMDETKMLATSVAALFGNLHASTGVGASDTVSTSL